MADTEAIAQATSMLLAALEEDPKRDGLKDTPRRVAHAWQELTSGYQVDPRENLRTTFAVESEGDREQIVLIKDIEFDSLCEHHLLPFRGVAHIAYIPSGGRIVGLSKVARMVDGYAHRLQVQERLTQEIALAMEEELQCEGVAVIITAEHLCMSMRGVGKRQATTTTSLYRGCLQERRAEIMAMV